MAFRFSDTFSMFDVTPVENLFLEEYMLQAPGDYVKAYLYGLRLCYHPDSTQGTMEAMSRALGLEESAVRDAFSYWERQGLLRRVSDNPPTYQYNNLKALLTHRAAPEEGMYRFREYNNALQKLFGARLLSPAEYTRASEWVEELNLSTDAVLAMVRAAIADRGGKVSFSYLDKMAASWAKAGIATLEAARDYLRSRENSHQGARDVLRAMGVKRAPTVAEEQLYQKWLDWGFEHAAITEALGELTRTANPNFAYLDRVLESAKERGEIGTKEVSAARKKREEGAAPVREVLSALGLSGGASQDLRELYAAWLEQGFDHGAVLHAARYAKREGKASMQAVGDMLARYAKHRLFLGADLAAYEAELSRERDAARALKALSGDEGAVTNGDVTRYRALRSTGLPEEVLRLAARQAAGARDPMALMLKIAQDWKAAGIATPEAAKDAMASREAGGGTTSRRKEVSAQKFGQREYSEQEWDALALDVNALEGEDG